MGLKNKNIKLLLSFAKYCITHPDERFWQALRNWSDYNFIYVSGQSFDNIGLIDTFYFEDKNQ